MVFPVVDAGCLQRFRVVGRHRRTVVRLGVVDGWRLVFPMESNRGPAMETSRRNGSLAGIWRRDYLVVAPGFWHRSNSKSRAVCPSNFVGNVGLLPVSTWRIFGRLERPVSFFIYFFGR